MKKLFVLLAAATGAHTVSAMPLTVPQIQEASSQTVKYDCRDGKSVSVRYVNTKNKQSFALLTVDGRKLMFVNVMSGSGAKYVADEYTWWTKGPEGNLSSGRAGENAPPLLADCKARK
ncbi:periplasmic protein [Caballeronia terrestris]|uniref:Periplasmic protein n=1 Tax=Caballeronia terrestris TaxID=1226301 RepID=A0A158JZ81_9BURK|nr:MliC family protein [Caballeronia terrestris]SAL74212.1 periplasmic protein [Caballeronia terrestris]